jgi:ABC-type amino acid transport substrate-binding protein
MRSKKKMLLALLVALPAFFLAHTAGAADSLEKAKQEGKILVGTGLFGTKPYAWAESDGTTKGFEYELMQAIGQKLGTKPEYVITEWTTMIPGLNSGRWDMIMSGMVKTQERMKGGDMLMSRPYFFVYDRIIVRDDSTIASLADLKGKIIASVLGTTDSLVAHTLVDQGLAAEVKDFNTFGEPFLALRNGQVEAVILDHLTYAGQKQEMTNIKAVGDPLFYVSKPEFKEAEDAADYRLGGVGIAVRKDDTALLDAVNKALDELDQEGTRQKILEQYGAWDEYQSLEAMMKK